MTARHGESQVQLDLTLLLPSVSDDADPCIDRLRSTLDVREGVVRVHVEREHGRAHLCVHFDPDRLSVARIEGLAQAAGLGLQQRYAHLDLNVRGLTNERRARQVSDRLQSTKGVLHARASASGARVHVELEPGAERARVLSALERMGVTLGEEVHGTDSAHDGEEAHEHNHGGIFGGKTELVFSLLGGGLTLGGWLVETTMPELTPWVAQGTLWAAYFFGGFYAVREAFEAMRVRRLEIDFLMLVAAVGAGALGEWTEGALLLFLFSLGHALEGYAMARARHAIEALAELAPKTATVLRGEGEQEEVPVEHLVVGDRVLVRPNSRVPADGVVVEGESAVNQAPITGESIPVDKRPVEDIEAVRSPSTVPPESVVFAGTINGTAALEVIVTKTASDSTLARVVTMVRQAQTQRSPTQRFTDRFERIFVPSVLALVVACLFAWVLIDEPFSASFYRAMAVLVAASPCALAIATPSAVLSGVARAARGGPRAVRSHRAGWRSWSPCRSRT